MHTMPSREHLEQDGLDRSHYCEVRERANAVFASQIITFFFI